ncbi:MAG: NCS1 family nucleobase:cation symporter-1 [Candidatus Euphemobacter frigidus]|nr:NCS1 family nucleobase:cation symporter-1 [Candidatus Euphemobacter frigidus]MDP8276011.1 NCS1 family nucleobase:cation symporter-1 [Candidatus Euphemobacter frigidus]
MTDRNEYGLAPDKEPVNQANGTERVLHGMHELTVDVSASPLANKDILPVPIKERTWNTWNIASLWVGISVCIPTYMLAASLMKTGLNWGQAIWAILLGNAIVLIPMCLNAFPGTKYGIPFPVLIRSSFGTRGAQIPSVLRGLVACGWFGIQVWIGGFAIYTLALIFLPNLNNLWPGLKSSFIGINGGELLCFLFFWALHMIIVLRGVESIKWFESLAAPALILVGVALFVWAINMGDGLASVLKHSKLFLQPTISLKKVGTTIEVKVDPLRGEDGFYRAERMRAVVLSGRRAQPEVEKTLTSEDWQSFKSEFKIDWMEDADCVTIGVELGSNRYKEASSIVFATAEREEEGPAGPWLLIAFIPALTAMVGYWATLSLNIPDFTRYAKSQKDQILGQAIGLPATMTLYAFVGVVATCAALIAFPNILTQEDAPWDPVALLANFKIPWMVVLSMAVLAIATLTTNIAANVVAPANGFSNLAPRKISFRMGGLITGIVGIVMMPWKLLATAGKFIFIWLIGYSALMGGVAGVMIADFYIVRRRKLNLAGLYQEDGPYKFTAGFNWVGIIAFILGVLPNIPGFLTEIAPQTFAHIVPVFWKTFYLYAWFSSFFISLAVYAVWMSAKLRRKKNK